MTFLGIRGTFPWRRFVAPQGAWSGVDNDRAAGARKAAGFSATSGTPGSTLPTSVNTAISPPKQVARTAACAIASSSEPCS